MAEQGSYPLNGRMLSPTDNVTGVVSGQTADIPLSILGAFLPSVISDLAVVSSIASLRLRIKTSIPVILVTGYYSNGDGGGGVFYLNPTDTTSPDNGGTLIVAADGGRWCRDAADPVSPLTFGAIGNGQQSNAAVDTAGVQACLTWFFGSTCPFDTLDLGGRTYIINAGWSIASTASTTGKLIKNGVLQIASGAPNNFYALDFSTATSQLLEASIEDVNIFGADVANGDSRLLLGGIKVASVASWWIRGCRFVGFSESAIKQTSTAYGQALYIVDCEIFGDFAGGFASQTTSNIAIDLAGGDNAVRGCQIGNANVLVHFGEDSNKLSDCHLFQYTNTSTQGIVVDKSQKTQILGNYIDTCGLRLADAGPGPYYFHGTQVLNNKFYLPPAFTGGVTFSPVTLAPKVSNAGVNTFDLSHNAFVSEASGTTLPVSVDLTSGSLSPTNIQQFVMLNNTFYGYTTTTSHPNIDITFSSTATASANLSSFIPFGNINYILGAAWEAGAPVAYSLSKSGTTITGTFATSVSGVLHVQATINDVNNV